MQNNWAQGYVDKITVEIKITMHYGYKIYQSDISTKRTSYVIKDTSDATEIPNNAFFTYLRQFEQVPKL